MYSVDDILYEGYGTDELGRTGVFRTHNKDEILSYVRKCNDNDVIVTLKVVSVDPVLNFRQLDFFNLLSEVQK